MRGREGLSVASLNEADRVWKTPHPSLRDTFCRKGRRDATASTTRAYDGRPYFSPGCASA